VLVALGGEDFVEFAEADILGLETLRKDAVVLTEFVKVSINDLLHF
jgi:hypothetical protein